MLNKRSLVLIGVIIVVLLVPLFFGSATANVGGVLLILRRSAYLALIALGAGYVISCGEIDLSAAGVVSFVGIALIVAAVLGWPEYVAVFCLLVLILALSALQGWLVAYRRIPSLILTLGVALALLGLSMVGYSWLHELPAVSAAPVGTASNSTLKVPTILPESWLLPAFRAPLSWLIVVVVVASIWRARSLAALKHLATGLDLQAAASAGIATKRIRLTAFIVAGCGSFMGAIIWLISEGGGWAASMGQGKELIAIAAAVLGGTSIRGGRFNPFNIALAQILLVSLEHANLTIDQIPAEADKLVIGMLVVGAAVADRVAEESNPSTT